MSVQEDGDSNPCEPTAAAPSEVRFEPGSERGTVLLFAVAGVRVRIHVAFGAIVLLLGVQALAVGDGQRAFFVPAVLLALLIHEMGHAFATRYTGQGSCTILLHPLLSQPPAPRVLNRPALELLTALAGPLANGIVCLAVATVFAAIGHRDTISLAPSALFTGGLLTRFVAFNLYLCGINLLPAFPLDGGRALRALLAMWWGDLRATRFVGVVSIMSALLAGTVALRTGNVFIGIFALLFVSGAVRELYDAPILLARTLGLRLGDVVDCTTPTFVPGKMAGEAARAVRAGRQSHYPVILGTRILGLVGAREILKAGASTYISELMTRRIVCTQESETVAALLGRGLPSLAQPVVITSTGTAEGDFIGLVCAESLRARLSVHAAGRKMSERDSATGTQGVRRADEYGPGGRRE